MDIIQAPGTYARRFFRSEQMISLLVAAGIGVMAAVGALIFRAMILGTEVAFWQEAGLTVEHLREVPWYVKLLLPAIGGLLLAPIVVKLAPEARGSGIPEVIESTAMHGGMVPARIVPLKALAAAICIGSGGSAGREGPIVHIGAAIGSWIAQRLRSSVKQMRTYVGCGVAGGIAATFNTPFAGALFAVEVVLGDFGTAKISPIVISSIIATVVSRHYSGEFPRIEVPEFTEQMNLLSISSYLLLGVAAAVISALFIKMMGWGWKAAARWPFSLYLLPAVGGLAVGVIGIFLPHVFGVGYDTINMVLSGEVGIVLMVMILFGKLIATSATLTSGGSGGIFAPSLFIGAMLGGIFGQVVHTVAPGLSITPEAYALIGMGAMVAGTTRAPISAILVIFELTYESEVILPLMAACIPSVIVSAVIHGDSIYIAKLTHKGVRLRKQGELNLLKGMQVRDVMQSRVPSVPPNMPLMDLVEKFLQCPFPVMWMVDKSDRLIGVVESHNLEIAMLEKDSLLGLVVAEDVAAPVKVPIRPLDDLSFAMKLFNEIEYEILPVVDHETGQVQGDLLRSDVINAYNRELAMRDSLAVAVDAIGVAERLGNVDLGGGYRLVEFEVPSHLAGNTLAKLHLRQRAGAQVILVRRGQKRLVPDADTELKPGDVLLLAGESEDIEQKLRVL